MFWLILFGVIIGPLIIIGVITDKKGKKRCNDNVDQNKKIQTDDDPRVHYKPGDHNIYH